MIYVFLADGFEETEALAPLDIIRRANLEIKTVGVTGQYVTGAHDIVVKADILPGDVKYELIDAVILPGGLGGTKNLKNSKMVKDAVMYANKNNKLICAICAAPSVLGDMNILNGKEATCYPGFESSLIGAKHVKKSVVKCDNFITSDGMGSSYKFAFEIVTALAGAEVADKIKEQIQY